MFNVLTDITHRIAGIGMFFLLLGMVLLIAPQAEAMAPPLTEEFMSSALPSTNEAGFNTWFYESSTEGRIELKGDDSALVTESVPQTIGTPSSSAGASLMRGNYFFCDTTVGLHRQSIHLGRSQSTDVQFMVYESTTENGTYALVSSSSVTAGVGTGMLSSGVMNTTLRAGSYYLLAASWNQAGTFQWSGAHPVETTFGRSLSGYENAVYPAPTSTSAHTSTRVFHQEFEIAANMVMRLDDSNPGSLTSINSTDLNLNLAGYSELTLSFRHRADGDVADAADGIFLSVDGGSTYEKIHTLSPASTAWTTVSIDLLAAAASKGLSLSEGNSLLRFQQSGSGSWPLDGREFDDIGIYTKPDIRVTNVTTPTPTYLWKGFSTDLTLPIAVSTVSSSGDTTETYPNLSVQYALNQDGSPVQTTTETRPWTFEALETTYPQWTSTITLPAGSTLLTGNVFTVSATADLTDVVDEENEDNNTASRPVIINHYSGNLWLDHLESEFTIFDWTRISDTAHRITGSGIRQGSAFSVTNLLVNKDLSTLDYILFPIASTLSPKTLTPNSAQLNGSIAPAGYATAYGFHYGTTTNLGSSTERKILLETSLEHTVSTILTGLMPNTTYYVQALASNALVQAEGDILSFHTGQEHLVLNESNSGPGSLRETLTAANDGDRIIFASELSGQTILLEAALDVDKRLVISAEALPQSLTLSGNHESRVLLITNQATVALYGLTISDGRPDEGLNGGGIHIAAGCTVIITDCLFMDNIARGITKHWSLYGIPPPGETGYTGGSIQGGALYNAGDLSIVTTTFTANQLIAGGGGWGGSPLTAPNGDQVGTDGGLGGNGYGGGVYNTGTLWVDRCTFSSNRVVGGVGGLASGGSSVVYGMGDGGTGGQGLGAALYNDANMTLHQSTLAENSGYGGVGGVGGNNSEAAPDGSGGHGGDAKAAGIYNAGTIALVNNTIALNAVEGGLGGPGDAGVLATTGEGEGGGIFNAGSMSITNTIVLENQADRFINISGPFSGVNNLTDGVASLAPLGDYGGTLQTMPPTNGSPAIDGGSHAVTNQFAVDQRGQARLSGRAIDVGAVEVHVEPPTIAYLIDYQIGQNPANGGITFELSASVNPNCELPAHAYFQYGLSSGYGGATALTTIESVLLPEVSSDQIVFVPLDFNSGNTYHWNVVAFNQVYTNHSEGRTFFVANMGVPGDQNGDGMVSSDEFTSVLLHVNGNGGVTAPDLSQVLASYWSNSPEFSMTNLVGLGSSTTRFALPGEVESIPYQVEYSTNLFDWMPLGPAYPSYEFSDPDALDSTQRFYRLRIQGQDGQQQQFQ